MAFTAETQTSDTGICSLFVFLRYWISPCLTETPKISHSLQLNYSELFQKAVSTLVI